MSEEAKEHVKFKQGPSTTRYYIPGKTPGQPYKENHFRYCYNITKRQGKTKTMVGDVSFLGNHQYYRNLITFCTKQTRRSTTMILVSETTTPTTPSI